MIQDSKNFGIEWVIINIEKVNNNIRTWFYKNGKGNGCD